MKSVQEMIKASLAMSHMVTETLLNGLSDEDLMVRPVPGANHIAWQLGHLISSENDMLSGIGADMPALPDGFVESHSKEASSSDDTSKFESKQRYLELYDGVRKATLAYLDKVTPDEMAQPSPEKLREWFPTVGDVLLLQPNHELMHVGQFSVVRRKKGLPNAI